VILKVHRDKEFDQRIQEYLSHGGPASLAARKACAILEKIVRRGGSEGIKFGRFTGKGEMRIKNCIKYDLGNGYRMICLRREDRFAALYIGTHDECSRWLDRNRDLDYDWSTSPYECIQVGKAPSSTREEGKDAADLYEEKLLEQLDDKILRKIFCGLCRRPNGT